MVAIDSVGVESSRGGRLWLEAFPLKVRGMEGTPCRAVVEEHPAEPHHTATAAASS